MNKYGEVYFGVEKKYDELLSGTPTTTLVTNQPNVVDEAHRQVAAGTRNGTSGKAIHAPEDPLVAGKALVRNAGGKSLRAARQPHVVARASESAPLHTRNRPAESAHRRKQTDVAHIAVVAAIGRPLQLEGVRLKRG